MSTFVFIASVGIWLGMVLTFWFVFLPTIRDTLSTPAADVLLPRLFSRYNLIGLLCGLSALAALSLAPPGLGIAPIVRLRLALPVSVALVCTLIMQYYLLPRMMQLRDLTSADAHERLRRVTAGLNSLTLVMLLVTIAVVASR